MERTATRGLHRGTLSQIVSMAVFPGGDERLGTNQPKSPFLRQPSSSGWGLEAYEAAPLPGMQTLVAAERTAHTAASNHVGDHEDEAAYSDLVGREPCQKIVYFLHNTLLSTISPFFHAIGERMPVSSSNPVRHVRYFFLFLPG